MGTKAHQRSPSRTALNKERKPPNTSEHSSAQFIKQPRQKKKKRTRRRKNKSQRDLLQVEGKSCSIHNLDFNSVSPENQESKTECYCDVKSENILPETHNLPAPAANPQGELHRAKMPTEPRPLVGKGRVQYSELAKEISSIQENRRRVKCPNVVEKRKFQSVSEYQFIYPGKSVFHCVQESPRQQLRSIYQVKADPKSPRSSNLTVRIPRPQVDIQRSLRGNPAAGANCPIGNDSLKMTYPNHPAHSLSGLTYKINKLILVKEKAPALLENDLPGPAENSHLPQLPLSPVSSKMSPLTETLQRTNYCLTKKEGWSEQYNSIKLQPGDVWGTLAGLPSHSGNLSRMRPVSAKEHYDKALDRMFGRRRNRPRDSPEKEKATCHPPSPGTGGAATALGQTKSAIVIPCVSHYSSSESLGAKGWKTAGQFLADKRAPSIHYVTLPQPALEEKLEKGLMQSSWEERGPAACPRRGTLSFLGT